MSWSGHLTQEDEVLQRVGQPIVVVRLRGEAEVAVHDGGLWLGQHYRQAGQLRPELADRDGGGQVEGADYLPVGAVSYPDTHTSTYTLSVHTYKWIIIFYLFWFPKYLLYTNLH